METKTKRKPDWSLCVKEGETWRSVGGGWDTERGNVYLRFDEGVKRGPVMMFPYREPWERRRTTAARKETKSVASSPALPTPPAVPPPPADDDDCPDPDVPSWLS